MAKNEVVKKESAQISTEVMNTADWGADQVDNREMLMPRLALMHGTSGLVNQDKADAGDIVNTASEKVLAKKGESLEIIPVKMLPKTWVVSKDGKWVRTELAKPNEDDREWEINGEKHERCLNFYVLVRKEMGAGEALPYLLAFKGTSIKAGRKLVNHFKLSQGLKKAPARTVFKLSSAKRSNDSNTWLVWNLDEAGQATDEELKKSYEWLLTLRALDDTLVTRYDHGTEVSGAGEDDEPPVARGEVREDARF